jgi:hypothetical protein
MKKREWRMFNKRKHRLVGMIAGLVILLLVLATPAFARSISLKDAGVALWIFIIIGVVIVLLQLIPAAILFFSFIGTSSSMVFKRKKEGEERVAEEKAVLPDIEAEPVKK